MQPREVLFYLKNIRFKHMTWNWFLLAFLSGVMVGCTEQPLSNSSTQHDSTTTFLRQEQSTAYSPVEPHAIAFNGSPYDGRMGGLIAADVDDDGQRDLIVSKPGTIKAYRYSGEELWNLAADIYLGGQSEKDGLPGLHGAGVQAGDVDGDGRTEVLYITTANRLNILDGATGTNKYTIVLPSIESTFNQWEHAIIANFQGQGDTDLLLQASNDVSDDNEYIRDNTQAAFSIKALIESGPSTSPLWQQTEFVSASHGPARVVDLDGDERDEVIGGTILSSDGQRLHDIGIGNQKFPHIDSIAIGDIVPSRPGLEAIIPEESGEERVILFDESGTIWESTHRQQSSDKDGDKVAIGNFDLSRPGLEMWFRGADSDHFTVLDARGELISEYRLEDRKPDDWTDNGLDVIHRIRWTGDEQEYIVAKERHEAGDFGIFDAVTGKAIAQFAAAVDRLYVADIVGDWREEIITVEGNIIKIYQNNADNPFPDHPSLWDQQHYRRQKMTWNYYST